MTSKFDFYDTMYPNVRATRDYILSMDYVVHRTGQWDEETGLNELAAYARGEIAVDDLVEMLWPSGGFVQNVAIIELLSHGNARQAVTFVKQLLEKYPITENTLRDQFGDMVDSFIQNDVAAYPSNPQEYPSDIVIRYIQ